MHRSNRYSKMLGVKVKRKALSLREKLDILRKYDVNRSLTQKDLAKSLDIPGSTLRTIVATRQKIEQSARSGGVKRKRLKTGKHDKLEKLLVDWFHEARSAFVPVNGPSIQEKAQEIAKQLDIKDFTGSNGWLDRFRQRHGIYRQSNGDAMAIGDQFVEKLASESLKDDEDWLKVRDISFTGYVKVDENVVACDGQSLERIVEEVKVKDENLEDEEGEDKPELNPVPTTAAVIDAIDTIRRYISSLPGATDNTFLHINAVEKAVMNTSSSHNLWQEKPEIF